MLKLLKGLIILYFYLEIAHYSKNAVIIYNSNHSFHILIK